MKFIIFILNLFLSLIPGVSQPPPMQVDPSAEAHLYCHFNRPFFPQWENGREVSNPGMGYRLEGRSVDMIIYGYDLDPEEEIKLENRDTLGRIVSTGSVYTDKGGKFFLRIDTQLPDNFFPERFYSIHLIRENGHSVQAGAFYVASGPPDDYYYVDWGNTLYGFNCDKAGKPYLLSWLSHGEGPNILDNYEGRGREFQGDLVDGYPEQGHDWKWNTVVPCQGAGDYGRQLPTVSRSIVNFNYIYAQTKPLDFEPRRTEMNGPYRQTVLQGRWPELGWNLKTEYEFNSNDVTLRNRFWHTDNYNHRVHQIRTAQMFLNPMFFQNPPLDESGRDNASYLQAIMNTDRIEAYSDALGIKITFRAGIDNYDHHYTQRHWNYRSELEMAEPGTVQVWECLNVAQINKFIPKNTVLSGWGKITITEAYQLGIGFDMEKFKEQMKMIFEQNRYDWGE